MGRIQISGNIPLNGSVNIQGCKNAALPLMAASVLHRGVTVLRHCPRILDVEYMSRILRRLGCRVFWEGDALTIDAQKMVSGSVDAQDATKFRASVLLMGGLLGRFGQAVLPYPGGCCIGERPIDFHLQAFQKLGVKLLPQENGIALRAERLTGGEIVFPFPSVGATENAVIGAALAQGITVIRGCAREPEIDELCHFLNEKGADIRGVGGDVLTIHGVERLKDSSYTLMADRIVTGTYLLAVSGTYGTAVLKGASLATLGALEALLKENGVLLAQEADGITVDARGMGKIRAQVRTAPYPGFPTDLQSQLLAFFSGTDAECTVEERIFESRFLTADELRKMGAQIRTDSQRAAVSGRRGRLRGTRVNAQDLRGGAALVVAGLMAQGETYVSGCEFIKRGHEDICRDLSLLGAKIQEIN